MAHLFSYLLRQAEGAGEAGGAGGAGEALEAGEEKSYCSITLFVVSNTCPK